VVILPCGILGELPKKKSALTIEFHALETYCPGIARRCDNRFRVLVPGDHFILQRFGSCRAARGPIMAVELGASLPPGGLWRVFCLSSHVAKTKDPGGAHHSWGNHFDSAAVLRGLRPAQASFG